MLQCVNGVLLVSDVNLLQGNHDEADTRIVFHLDHIDLLDPGHVIVRATDSAGTVILLINNKVFENCKLWMDIGRDIGNSRRYLDITNISKSFNDIIPALPGLYSFTGIECTPAFYNKGKIKPYELMEKNKKYIELFTSFGEAPITEEMICDAEILVCEMYGFPKVKKLGEARYMPSKTKYKPKSRCTTTSMV